MSKKTPSFEESLARLEEILHTLEGGEVTLDVMLKLYGEGVELIRSCNTMLENAEQSVKMLSVGQDGSVKLADFKVTEE